MQVTIIGVGLIGGSLGMALRRQGYHVVGVGRKRAHLALAKRKGAIDDGTLDPSRGVQQSAIVVVATPVDRIVPIVHSVWPWLSPGTLVTDVGSVKAPIVRGVRAAARRLSRRQAKAPVFIGGHPLAGSHQQGVRHARADLFEGATCVLTPPLGVSPTALAVVQRMWRSVGARPLLLDPILHDRWVALTSHLPHLTAAALVHSVGRQARQDRRVVRLLAGSFRDLTRVAVSDPEQWAAITWGNRQALARALKTFRRLLMQAERALPHQRALIRFFQWSKNVRATLLNPASSNVNGQ
ncbi:MAG: prephenate dehydrogenase/arogenate dehydrogenase family protein [Elusimicrobia bacterium]|nr:prephenate dehydrogenase/arogenate dehydrogenase family protein [Elusimicrobiota bacterium]